MTAIRFTLLGEGPTDRRLLPIIEWLLLESSRRAVAHAFADLGFLDPRPNTLQERIAAALEFFPCDILCVHRDADRESRAERRTEILGATPKEDHQSLVCVIPVRAQETWLLIDEVAIRKAARRPSGREPLALPRPRNLERLADPKALLRLAIRTATGLKGRRLARFDIGAALSRLPYLMEDFRPLAQLAAFRAMEAEVKAALRGLENGAI
jgi:hypothetical protein